jgi:hypothetical protein
MNTTIRAAAAVACLVAVGACSDSSDPSPAAVPPEAVQLIDDWEAALQRGDGSVVELYTPSGYHLYGTTKYAGDEIATHLRGGGDPADHVWVTDPVLIVDEGDRYIVAGGLSNNVGGTWYTSSMSYEMLDTPDGLRIAQSAWLDATWSNHTDPSSMRSD